MSYEGILFGQDVFLQPPYGKCGSPQLNYYEIYSHSYCLMECITEGLNRACNCTDAYMPGKSNVIVLRNVIG